MCVCVIFTVSVSEQQQSPFQNLTPGEYTFEKVNEFIYLLVLINSTNASKKRYIITSHLGIDAITFFKNS